MHRFAWIFQWPNAAREQRTEPIAKKRKQRFNVDVGMCMEAGQRKGGVEYMRRCNIYDVELQKSNDKGNANRKSEIVRIQVRRWGIFEGS